MKKIMTIAAAAAAFTLASCGDEVEHNSSNVVVNETGNNVAGPCGDGTYPAAGERCK